MVISQLKYMWSIGKLAIIVLFFSFFWVIFFGWVTYAECPESRPINIGNDGDNTICISEEEYKRIQDDWIKRKKCDEIYGKPYCTCKYDLKWIYLNTEVPFVWAPGNPRCLIVGDSQSSATTTVLNNITRILMTFVMIGWFATIIWWWVQIASWDVKWGKAKIIWVIVAFAVLWSLWVILRFINPNFFA